jgi:hypothetical protein
MDDVWCFFGEKKNMGKVNFYEPSVYVALDQYGDRFLRVVV